MARASDAESRPSIRHTAGETSVVHERRPWLTSAWSSVLLGAICTVNSVSNQFAYDDGPIIQDNGRIRSLANFREIWLSDWWKPQTEDERIVFRMRDRLYRPLTMFSFAMNYAVHGASPVGYHVLNVLLHAAACALVWCFIHRLFEDRAIAACAAALFAVHPIHSEAVANVVGRAEVLAAVFVLVGLIGMLPRRGLPSTGRIAGAAAAFLAAMLSKETAVCYPALAALVLAWRANVNRAVDGGARKAGQAAGRRSGKTALATMVMLLVPAAIYFPLRYAALDGHLLRDRAPTVLFNPLIEATTIERILTPFAILAEYFRIFIVPNRLSSDYGIGVLDRVSGPDLRVMCGVALTVAVVFALGGYRAVHAWRRRMAVLTALFLVSYVLISNTVLLIGVNMAERLMYWPSVPVVGLFATLAVELWRRLLAPGAPKAELGRIAQFAGLAFLVVLALRTVVRNQDWHDNLALFRADIATHPRSAVLNLNGGELLLGFNRPELTMRAIEHIRRGLEIHPRNAQALNSLARAYYQSGDKDKARRHIEASLTFDPVNPPARRLLTLLEHDVDDLRARAVELQAAATTRPGDLMLLTEAVDRLRQLGKAEDARRLVEQAVQAAPGDVGILYLYGESLILVNEAEKAREVLERVVRIDPDHFAAHSNLVNLLAGVDAAGALEHARIAHRLAPDDYRANVNLAEALALTGQTRDSVRLWKRILSAVGADDPQRPAIEDRIREIETRGR